MDALADLEELQEALSSSTAVKADDNAQLADMAAKFFKGLSVIHLVCNTGQGIPLFLPLPCFRTANLCLYSCCCRLSCIGIIIGRTDLSVSCHRTSSV